MTPRPVSSTRAMVVSNTPIGAAAVGKPMMAAVRPASTKT